MAEPTIKCKALAVFTEFVSGHGMVHGNPDAKDAKLPEIPHSAVAKLTAAGMIEAPKNWVDPNVVDDAADEAPVE